MFSTNNSGHVAVLFALGALLLPPLPASAKEDRVPVVSANVKVYDNLVYATRSGGRELKLDLYVPAGSAPKPLVIWIHGGGWTMGGKGEWVHPLFLTEDGFAVASIQYRFSSEAIFPAQIQDCKSAVRFLRSNAAKYGLDTNRFAAMGESAGGNLTSLLATTAGDSKLSDPSDDNVSDTVQAAIDLCGPADLSAVPDVAPPGTAAFYTAKLLGNPPSKVPDLARQASPVFHITKQTPPFMILHAQGDPVCPVDQSKEFYAALQKAGVTSSLTIFPDNQHVGPFFWTDAMHQKMLDFLQKSLNISQ